MLSELKVILEIQELDMKMIRLMRLKKERMKELQHIESLRRDLRQQQVDKEAELSELSRTITNQETKIQEIQERVKKLESRQSSVKKVDEFNALTHEMTQAEREKIAAEQLASDLIDKRALEEEILEKIKSSLRESEESSRNLEAEIANSIHLINQEGQQLKHSRDVLAKTADTEVLRVYEQLLNNKKDRVVVPTRKPHLQRLPYRAHRPARKPRAQRRAPDLLRALFPHPLLAGRPARSRRRSSAYQDAAAGSNPTHKTISCREARPSLSLANTLLRGRGKSGLHRRGYQ